MRATESKSARNERTNGSLVPLAYRRPKALICKPGPEDVLDRCLLCLGDEVDVEQVSSLAEGLQRCLDGHVDILFVNLFSYTARELTALAAFRSLRPDLWVVAIARRDMKSTLLGTGLADEVFVGRPHRANSASLGPDSTAL